MFSEKEKYWKLILDFTYHEDKLFTSRVNLFFVAESILILSFSTLLTNEKTRIISVILTLVGTYITVVYLLFFKRQLKMMDRLKNAGLDEKLDLCPEYRKMRNEIYKMYYPSEYPHIHFYLGIIIPITFLLTWLGLMMYCLILIF